MMKQVFTYIFLFLSACVSAQSMAKRVVGNSGSELAASEVTLNFTIGEPIVGLIANEESIDQGFWAGSLSVEPITEVEELGGIEVYPNPMVNELNILTNNNPVYGITMFSVNGKMALKQRVESTQLEHRIDVAHLAQGMYVLRLSIKNETEEKLFKVIKK